MSVEAIIVIRNVQHQLKGFTKDLARKLRQLFETLRLEHLTTVQQPQDPKATIIFSGLSRNKFRRGGKVTALEFLPTFCNILRQNGYQTKYTSSIRGLSREIQSAGCSVVVMIYREVGFVPDQPGLNELLDKADIVLHHPEIGNIIGHKTTANIFLSQRGVPMPQLQTGDTATEAVFSNHNNSSGAEVFLIPKNSPLDKQRYNSRLVDTRVNYAGKDYYTTVRLMCIGKEITHAFVRARPVSDGNPSVHTKDTPIDLDLLLNLQTLLVEANKANLKILAETIATAIGPGFYSHDVLIDCQTKELYLAETGFKFDNANYLNRISNIAKYFPAMKGFSNPAEIAASSAPIFIEVLEAERSKAASVPRLT